MTYNDMKYKLRRSKIVRILYAPVAILEKALFSFVYPKTLDSAYIASLKDSHKGERCFIVGNGPSITVDDLNKLKEEYCFGTNRIYYIFDKTKWRPRMYVSFDLDVIAKEKEQIHRVEIENKLLNLRARNMFPKETLNTHYIFIKGKFKINRSGTGQTTVNDDLSKFVTMTDNVTGVCLELAYYMGFSEIYLVGVDHNYPDRSKTSGNANSNYFTGIKGTVAVDFNLEATNTSYQTLRNYAVSRGIRVYNATRGGKLEIFERANFDEIVL